MNGNQNSATQKWGVRIFATISAQVITNVEADSPQQAKQKILDTLQREEVNKTDVYGFFGWEILGQPQFEVEISNEIEIVNELEDFEGIEKTNFIPETNQRIQVLAAAAWKEIDALTDAQQSKIRQIYDRLRKQVAAIKAESQPLKENSPEPELTPE